MIHAAAAATLKPEGSPEALEEYWHPPSAADPDPKADEIAYAAAPVRLCIQAELLGVPKVARGASAARTALTMWEILGFW